MDNIGIEINQKQIYQDLRNLLTKSLVYGIGSVSLKLISFLLIPIYTRFLTPEDYGIVAVTSSVLAVLVIILSFEMRGAINYFYINAENPKNRNRNISMIWISMLVLSFILTILLDKFGNRVFPIIFLSIPFNPYFRLVIWTAFLTIAGQFPLVLLQVKEKPIPLVALLLSSAILNIGLSMFLIVYLRQGAYGYLLGAMMSSLLMTIPYLIITVRMVHPKINLKLFLPIVYYCFPLVFHSLSAWVLEYSDRVILEKYVSLQLIGIYSLAYQFGSVVYICGAAINSAWVPLIYRIDGQYRDEAYQRISGLITYFVAIQAIVFLFVGLFLREINILATPNEFHGAYLLAYWIALGQLFHGLYFIPVNFLFMRARTKYVPVITVTSSLINVSLNLFLVPKFGVQAVVVSGLISKIVMVVSAYMISKKIYPIPYEVRRIGKMLLVVGLIFIGSLFINITSVGLTIIFKFLLFILSPVLLYFIGFPNEKERQSIINISNRIISR